MRRLVPREEQYSSKVCYSSRVKKIKNCRTFVIAPLSAVPLDESVVDSLEKTFLLERGWGLYPVRKVDFHINLDDVDLNKESLVETISRVVGRHGLGVWLLVSV